MTTVPSLRTLLALAWPMIVARSSQAVIGFADALMSAPLGEDALAAVTTGAMNTFAVILLPTGVVFIAQSFAAQLQGRGQVQAAVRYAWYALAIAALTAGVAVALIPAMGPVLALAGYTGGVHAHMTEYLQIRMWGVGAAVAVEALGNWYGGLGNTRVHMRAGVIAMVLNVGLNWVLIHGHLGAPALGTAGAAWASVIATYGGLGVLVLAFTRRAGLEGIDIAPKGLRLAEAARMVRFGLPHGFNWFLEFAAFALFINVIVAGLGTTVLAAMMVVFNLNSVSFMPAFGLTSAGAILTGQAIGAGQHDHVGAIVRRTLGVTLAWQGSVGVLYLAAPDLLMGAFASSEQALPELVKVGAVMLALSACWQLFDAVGMTLGEALRSAGDTAWVLLARLVIAWFVFTPAAYFTVSLWGGDHVHAMLCMIGYLGLLAAALAWRFRSGAWRQISLLESEALLLPDEANIPLGAMPPDAQET